MRWAKSYSIIDHELLHGGYFQRLPDKSLVLYLFLVVVSDREGKSFYSNPRIMNILGFKDEDINVSRYELIKAGLIDYRSPFWFVRNISEKTKTRITHPGCLEKVQLDPKMDREYGKKCIQDILKKLSKNCKE